MGPTVRLATWNLRQFSAERPGIDLRTIADIIRSSSFDLVAIQEVKRDGEMVDRLLNALGPPWRSTALSPMTGNSERFAFIFNADHVESLDSPAFLDIPDVTVFDRRPFVGRFRSGTFDFTVLSVHLSYADRDRRQREARLLASCASSFASTHDEKDLVILGDFNEQGQGNLHFIEAAGFVSLNHDSTNLGSSAVYDTLLIDPRQTREWSGQAGVVHFDEAIFANDDRRAVQAVSDHRPVWADFATTLPDDD